MSKWNFEQAIAPWLAKQKEEAMQATWGHLAPQKNKEYHGRMVFAVGCFGNDEHNPTPILCEFGDLESSPWFFEFLQEFLQELEVEVGCVYQFRGVFKITHLREKFRFCLIRVRRTKTFVKITARST